MNTPVTASDSELRTPIHSRDVESPTYVDVPFWITACVRLAPPLTKAGRPTEAADKVFPVAQALLADQHRTVDAAEVELDRELIARIAGYTTAKRGQWIVDYLQRIGFLRIHKHYEPGTGRRSADTFVASRREPLGYVGPTTYAGLVDALRSPHPDARALFVDLDGNPRSEPRSATAEVGPEAYYRDCGSRVQNPRSEPRSATAEVADRRTRGRERTPTGFSPSRSIDQTLDAESAASASDEAVRELVRHLPWNDKGHRLSVANADKLSQAIASAVTKHGLTMTQAKQHALSKLAESTSPGGAARFVIDGFAPKNLPEPVADDANTLPLPDLAIATDTQVAPASAAKPQARASLQPIPAPVHLPACGTCGAQDGEGMAVRTVNHPATNSVSKCPDCRPYAHAAA